ncbi:hypothetical protein PAPH110629_14475 [Paenibacillus phoenicis]|jgi:hypothetical protein|nr:hypothetical protein SAMN02744102_02514 [Paenibacillus barengoltzii]
MDLVRGTLVYRENTSFRVIDKPNNFVVNPFVS